MMAVSQITENTCPPWCTDHKQYEALEDCWHATGNIDCADAVISMSTGTTHGDIRIFGLWDVGRSGPDGGESITVEQAEEIAFLLLGLVAAARRDVA